MQKNELRKKFKALRSRLTSEEIEEKSLLIANQSLKLPIWNYDYFHLFLSITENKEVNTEYLLHVLQGKDKHVILPKTDFSKGGMKGFLLTDQTVIKKNAWNIPEPVEGIEINNDQLEVVFLPLLAYDKKGNRIGYGKGFYDRFLAECRPDVLKIGLSFFEPVDSIIETYEDDIPLDFCVTPLNIHHFVQ